MKARRRVALRRPAPRPPARPRRPGRRPAPVRLAPALALAEAHDLTRACGAARDAKPPEPRPGQREEPFRPITFSDRT